MRIHCFGTTGYHPSPNRHTAAYYLPELSMMLDAGTGLFRLIECLQQEPNQSLDILLSHAHLDHTVGLTFLIDVMAVTSLKKVRVHGAIDKLNAVRDHLFNPLLFPVEPSFEFISLEGESGCKQIGDSQVHWFPLEHPGGSLGFIIEAAGKRLAYVSDTVSRVEAEYVSMIHGLDLLLHECYFADDQMEFAIRTGHSWTSEVENIIQTTKPRRALLIHINPLANQELIERMLLRVTKLSGTHVQIAEDGLILNF